MARHAGESIGNMFRRMAANDEKHGRDNPENPNNRKDGVRADDGREDWENGADASGGSWWK